MSSTYNLRMNKKDILKEFGRNLKAERNRAGLSQEQLAEKIGVSYGQVVGMIERGETNTSLSVIVSILNALNLDFDALFNRKKYFTQQEIINSSLNE